VPAVAPVTVPTPPVAPDPAWESAPVVVPPPTPGKKAGESP
jgi:hypothetical protein